MTRAEVMQRLSDYLVDLFEVEESAITEEALLYDDLDLDSIDAVDLIVELQTITGRKIPPDEFKSVRTIGDVVDRVCDLIAQDG